jgi:thiol-disulfide isomerase/thioredoxin
VFALTGCSALGSTGDKGYISGDGQIVQYHPADRDDPVELTGTSLEDTPLDVTDYRGKVVVLVVWAAWCAPCAREAPDLAAAATELGGVAQFVGIDIRDNQANAQAFVRNYEITYPSVFDPDGRALLGFPNGLGPRTIPAFAVLDKQGRVAATIRGELPSKLTLVDLVEEIAAEDG